MLNISIRHGHEYYRARVTPAWARKHDNGALISCGLTVGQDGFTPAMLANLRRRGKLTLISADEWNHSGCQSRCRLRGDALCQW